MQKFDRLKIISNVSNISDIDHSKFIECNQGEELLYYKYKQTSPYLLLILINVQKSELVIDFTGKILGDRYPELINKENIWYCFEQINDLGICNLNIAGIMSDGIVGRCDITKDVILDEWGTFKGKIGNFLKDYKKWTCKEYKGGIVVENTVATQKYQKRIIMYDKGKELSKSTNRAFIDSLSEPQKMLSYFANKIRVEQNLTTQFQIRIQLNIESNSLTEVLNSKANPLLKIIDEAFVDKNVSNISSYQNLREYEHYLLLKDCDFDLLRIEGVVRSMIGKSSSLKRAMEPFRELSLKVFPQENVISNIRAVLS